MPYIMNALNEKVTTQAHGKYFTWQPGEIKILHNVNLANFIAQHRGEEGLVEIQDHIQEMDRQSEEYKQVMFEKRKEGIAKYLRKQNWIVRNLEMSLRRDYETSGQKGNFLFEASPGELAAYKVLVKYKDYEAKENLNNADEIQKVREQLYGNASQSNPAKVESERPSPLAPAKK